LLKRLPPFYSITIMLIIITVICLLYPGSISYYLFSFALLIASVLMIIHLVLAWSKLALTSRLGIMLSIVAWLGLFYGLNYTNGLTISNFF